MLRIPQITDWVVPIVPRQTHQRWFWLALFLVVTRAGDLPGKEDQIVIVDAGQSEYTIVVPDHAEDVVRFAASELQHFVKQISGVRLPIVKEQQADKGRGLWIGPTRRASQVVGDAVVRSLKNDGVCLQSHDGDLFLCGASGRGQLYAVYELLERYWGVRFLTLDCTVIPRLARLSLPPVDYHYSPPFYYRETSYLGSHPGKIATRQRLNGNAQQCDASQGGHIYFFPWVHSFYSVVSNEKYFPTHPEFFSLVDGKRNQWSQLCLTNREMQRVAVEQVLQWLEDKPQITVVDVSQREGGRFCECGPCRDLVEKEGDYAPILLLVNTVADAVAEKYPDKWVSTLGYNYMPPQTMRPRDNVVIRITHAGCYIHGATACPTRDGGAQLFLDSLDAWRKVTHNTSIWHYTTNFGHYLAPRRNLNGLAIDLKFYADQGVGFGVFVQGNSQSGGGELSELRRYLAAKLLWDPHCDPMQVRQDFCHGYYGPAAPAVLRFLELMDRAHRDPDIHFWASPEPPKLVSLRYLREVMQHLEGARQAAVEPTFLTRVEKLFLPYWYVQLYAPEHYDLTDDEIRQLLPEFQRVVRAHHVTRRREQPTPDMEGWIAMLQEKYGG